MLQEIYSIKLPGNPKVGEGKPENQNHAVVFTRGNAVQTIDMNQVWITLCVTWSQISVLCQWILLWFLEFLDFPSLNS